MDRLLEAIWIAKENWAQHSNAYNYSDPEMRGSKPSRKKGGLPKEWMQPLEGNLFFTIHSHGRQCTEKGSKTAELGAAKLTDPVAHSTGRVARMGYSCPAWDITSFQ